MNHYVYKYHQIPICTLKFEFQFIFLRTTVKSTGAIALASQCTDLFVLILSVVTTFVLKYILFSANRAILALLDSILYGFCFLFLNALLMSLRPKCALKVSLSEVPSFYFGIFLPLNKRIFFNERNDNNHHSYIIHTLLFTN